MTNPRDKDQDRYTCGGLINLRTFNKKVRSSLLYMVIYLVAFVDVLTDTFFWWGYLPRREVSYSTVNVDNRLWQMARCTTYFDGVPLPLYHMDSDHIQSVGYHVIRPPRRVFITYYLCKRCLAKTGEKENEGEAEEKNKDIEREEDNLKGKEKDKAKDTKQSDSVDDIKDTNESVKPSSKAFDMGRVHLYSIAAFWLGDFPLTVIHLVVGTSTGETEIYHTLRKAALIGTIIGVVCKTATVVYKLVISFRQKHKEREKSILVKVVDILSVVCMVVVLAMTVYGLYVTT